MPFRMSQKDKMVAMAFLSQEQNDSKKLTTDGSRLDGNWMGGRGIAEWVGDQIKMNDLGGKASQTVHNFLRKNAPRRALSHDNALRGKSASPQERIASLLDRVAELEGKIAKESSITSQFKQCEKDIMEYFKKVSEDEDSEFYGALYESDLKKCFRTILKTLKDLDNA